MGERRRRLSAAWGVCIALALATPASAQDVESDQESDTEPEEVSLFGYTKDEGFRLRSEDGNYRLQIAMRAGLKLEPAWTEGDGRVNEALAFLRPVLRGNLFREWLGFTFSMELAANDPFVLDAFVDIAPWEEIGFVVGQQGTPVGRHSNFGPHTIFFPEFELHPAERTG